MRGRRTNVSLVHDACIEDAGQRRHLEAGPGTHVGALLLGRTSGVGWRAIFARARRWYEGQVTARPSGAPPDKVFLFGLLRPARRLFPKSLRRHRAVGTTHEKGKKGESE